MDDIALPKRLFADEDQDDDGFILKRRRPQSPEAKRIKPLQPHSTQFPLLEKANFNPFFAPEAPSLISMNSSFASPCDFEDEDDEEEDDEESMTFTRRFSTTLSFVEPDQFSDEHDETVFSTNCLSPPTSTRASLIRTPFFSKVHSKIRFHHKDSPIVGVSRFNQEFDILGELGKGSFGEVFKVQNKLDGCLYAVKMVKLPGQKSKSARERVLKEVYALAALVNNSDNLHVVRYFSSWIDLDDRLYIQTELCEMSLEAMLQNTSVVQNTDLEGVAIEILKQLLQGLKGLHLSNVVHLDIKPGNILVKSGTYKLGDLGHVCLSSFRPLPPPPPFPNSQRDTIMSIVQDDVVEGDSRYMAFELMQERHDHLPKADIFSLAISMYEMFLFKALGEKLPSEGEEWQVLRRVTTQLPSSPLVQNLMSPEFTQLMVLMMQQDAQRRPSAEALLASGGPGEILGMSVFQMRDLDDEKVARRKDFLHRQLKRSNTM